MFQQPTGWDSNWLNGVLPQSGLSLGSLSGIPSQPTLNAGDSGLFQQSNYGGPTTQLGGGFLSNTGLGMNMPTLQFGLGALQGLSGLFNGMQANRLARDQFNLTKDVTNTNLNNSIKSYNTSLSDRAYSRAAQEGRSADSAQAYIDSNRLTRQ